jgi:hypothetical protein
MGRKKRGARRGAEGRETEGGLVEPTRWHGIDYGSGDQTGEKAADTYLTRPNPVSIILVRV